MKFLYYILHTLTGCPEDSLRYFKSNAVRCSQCGRVTFIFHTYS